MIRISSAKISVLASELDGIELQGIHFKQEGSVEGIQALFSVDTDDEELAKSAVKKYFKENHAILKIYVEVI